MTVEESLKNILPYVDEGIRTLVEGLIRIGAPTCWSCQGHLEKTSSTQHPEVEMCIDIEDEDPPSRGWLEKLAVVIAEWESSGKSSFNWVVRFHYSPGCILVILEPDEENPKRDPKLLSRLHQEAEGLGRFLINEGEAITAEWGLS